MLTYVGGYNGSPITWTTNGDYIYAPGAITTSTTIQYSVNTGTGTGNGYIVYPCSYPQIFNDYTIYSPPIQQYPDAEKKAETLLKKFLDEEQKKEYENGKCFHVISKSGTRYRIRLGRSRNISELDSDGKEVNRYCIHPGESVPDGDTILAQKFLIEANEEEFKRIANKQRVA